MFAALVEHPACASVAPYLQRLEGHSDWPSIDKLDALFADRLRIEPAVQLEEQASKRGRGRAAIYEVRIFDQRKIPTRAGSWHDLMNLCVWAAFPRSKRALTARQHGIATARVAPDATKLPSARTREQDALAMLDEGGALLIAADDVQIDLHAPGEIYASISQGRIVLRLFGHALLEAVATGELERRDLRGAVEVLRCALDTEAIDAHLAARIADPNAFRTPDPARSLWLRGALRT